MDSGIGPCSVAQSEECWTCAWIVTPFLGPINLFRYFFFNYENYINFIFGRNIKQHMALLMIKMKVTLIVAEGHKK